MKYTGCMHASAWIQAGGTKAGSRSGSVLVLNWTSWKIQWPYGCASVKCDWLPFPETSRMNLARVHYLGQYLKFASSLVQNCGSGLIPTRQNQHKVCCIKFLKNNKIFVKYNNTNNIITMDGC